ncbi:MAG: hypothetical protein V1688_00185 [bacterium]
MNFKFKKFKKQFFSLIILFSIFFSFNFVFAVAPAASMSTTPSLKTASGELSAFGGKSGFSTTQNLDTIIGSVIKYILSFMGVIFLALLIYGGFIWMLAKGESEDVTKSKDIMTNAVIGLGIVLGAYVITAWIVGRLAATTLK